MIATTTTVVTGEDREQRHAMELSRMIQHLRKPGLRQRTGLLLVQRHRLLDLADVAARLDMNLVDYNAIVEAEIPEGATIPISTPDHEIQRLQAIGQEARMSALTLVANTDSFLAHWVDNSEYRRQFWYNFEHRIIKTTTAVILALPITESLHPDKEAMTRLTHAHRWAVLPNHLPEMRNRAS